MNISLNSSFLKRENVKNEEGIVKSAEPYIQIPKIENLKEMIEKSIEKNANHIAFRLKNKVGHEEYLDIPMQEFAETIDKFGAYLIEKGYKDKRIGVFSENRYEWGVAYLAIVNGAGVVVPMDKSLPKEEIKKILVRSELEQVVTSIKSMDMLLEIIKEGGTKLKNIILMDLYVTEKEQKEIENKLSDKEISQIVSTMSEGPKEIEEKSENIEKYRNIEIDNDKTSMLIFTSATTSNSKAVMLSHKNIANNIYDILTVFDLGTHDRMLSFLPIHHCFECTVGFLTPIYAGSTICYADSLKKLGDNIKEYEITAIIGVPQLLENIYEKLVKTLKKKNKYKTFMLAVKASNTMRRFGIDKRREIFSEVHKGLGGKLRLVVSGAAALNPTIQKALQDIGVNIYQGYGATETSPVVASASSRYDKIGSVGRVLPTVEVKIDKKEGQEIGEILVKGPSVMSGYYNDEESNKAAFTEDGWFRTGDLGYVDKDNYLYISGRTKNVIVLKNGKNIFPDESEALLNNIEGVLETMVFALPAPEDETDVMLSAKIVYDENIFENMEEKEIKEQIWEQVKIINKLQPTYKYIKNIYITKEPLIKTTTMKVKRYEEMKKIQKMIKEEK